MLKQIILLAASSVITLSALFGGAPEHVGTVHRTATVAHTARAHSVPVEKVIQLKEVVISVPRPKASPAAAEQEAEPKQVKCTVRELIQGSGLVRICE